MFKLDTLTTFCLFVFISTTSAQYIRFVNALQTSQSITITTDGFTPIKLEFTEVSGYVKIEDGNLVVKSVDSGALQLSKDILINFSGYYATVAVTIAQGVYSLILFSESNNALISSERNPSFSFVRLIDLSPTATQVGLAANGSTMFDYVGYLQMTPFRTIDTRIQWLTVTSSTSSTSFVASFTPLHAYTIFFFETAGNFYAKVILDRPAIPGIDDRAYTTSNPTTPGGAVTTRPYQVSTSPYVTPTTSAHVPPPVHTTRSPYFRTTSKVTFPSSEAPKTTVHSPLITLALTFIVVLVTMF